MDLDGPVMLTNILSKEELEEVSKDVQDKLKSFIDKFFDEYCKEKAAANRLERYEQKTEELQSQIQDYTVKLQSYEQNVAELRSQLDNISQERANLLDLANNHEKDYGSLRIEKNNIAAERDSLLKVIERQNTELERLQQDIRAYQQQLKAAINSKCEAIARVDEVESKEVSLEFKEKRMEQERGMLQSQIQQLTEDLHRNVSELQNVRRESTLQKMHVEARLNEKVEELKIVQTQNGQYKETNERLSQNIQELSNKLLNQNEEANKMMDFYKRELEAKTKLAELYRGNCDDNDMERNELESAIADLKRMLNEASEQYGEMETNMKAANLQYEEDIEQKEKTIELLKSEIAHANDLLKEVQQESVESAISKLAPSAAVASRLIRSDMSLTELYSLYVKTTEDCEQQKRENARLNLQLKTILQELSENAPVIKKQEIDFEKLIETNNILVQQRDELLSKKCEYEEHIENDQVKLNHLERENKKLRHAQSDLSRQVCFLLKEVEQLRIGLIVEQENMLGDGNMSTTDDVISKKLVTFNSIAELQENNQKLLLLVRDLSGKLEEAEIAKQDFNESILNGKLQSYVKKLQNMQDTLNKQNNTVATLVSKCERYKKMYFEIQKNLSKSMQKDISDNDETDNLSDSSDKNEVSKREKKSSDNALQRQVRDLEQQLNEVRDQYKTLKEQYEYYSQEKKNNEKILNEQFDSMRTELRDLTSSNCKLMSTVDYNKEQVKLQQRNISTYKQQIATLEDRNKNYENTIFKHEQTVNYLRDEIIKAQRTQTSAEAEVNHLRHENRILKDTAARLQSEKECFNREQKNQSLLLNNLELIKANLERSEIEGRSRLEQRLDDTVRELSAQRRRFQEEEDRFRETINDLNRQTLTAKKLMDDEKTIADKLAKEMITLREEIASKTNQIDDLSRKLQESLTPSKNDNPILLANKKAREYEIKLEECKIEISALSNELAKAQQHAEQYYKMSQSAESEIKNLHDVHSAFVLKAEAEIKMLKQNELNFTSRIEELEAEVQLAAVADKPTTNQCDQLKQVQEELKDALQKLSECNRNLRTLRSENSGLSETLNVVETKYANEMIMHSSDIQELTKIKAETSKVQTKIDQLQAERDQAMLGYDELKRTHDGVISLLQNEKEELEKRIDNLNNLNSNLHDQIEALSTKLSMLTQSNAGSTSFSGTDSLMDTSSLTSDLNRTLGEEENKNNDQLLQIIKFLRKEKDINVAKLDILKAENTRLLSEHTILQKKIDELNGFLNQERSKSETNIMSATKHEEVLRKIETYNAITDSNRILREERNALSSRVKELNERISKIEDELFPLQNKNRELSSKVEELTTENTSLRTEAIKWRQRANLLVEKSNKNPEEFKRLQAEREQLAKMLSSEKEIHKQATDELNILKARLENDIPPLERQIHVLSEEKKKVCEELTSIKQNHTRMLQEVMELKVKLLQKEDALQKCTEDIESKDIQLQDSKSKEMQIRKIAKRYKDSYLELAKKSPNNTEDGPKENASELQSSPDGSSTELQQHRSTIESLNNVIRTMQEENEKIRKDYDDLKATAEVDEQTKALLRDARSKIVSLTESKNVISQELVSTKNKLQNTIQTSESHDAIVNGIKSQYEETLSRMEKELLDQNNINKEAVARLTRENESLLMRINQLSRQLGHQQSSKPSTSSVAITDKGCISESSPRTANVKPMSGSATVQQSATVTPWRGGETPLASIRPITVQNSRTAAILPTSQQTSAGSSSTSSTSSTSTTSSTASSGGNTALVPPQQVHTTGSSTLEAMSSSPTSSHTDYMPSTSSASVAVAAIPPMGSAASAAESSQEAESVQQQQNESSVFVSGGQQQVVALVSPRVEGSQNIASPVMQLQEPLNQQPSTSGSTSSTTHIAVSTHSRHAPSSSSVTTTQAGSSISHKRPRDQEGDSSTGTDECVPEKILKQSKRLRTPMHLDETVSNIGDMGIDVDQVPTSSQRDQEDDIVVVDSEEDDGIGEADDGPADVDAENEGYEDSYEQDQEMDENECPEINEGSFRVVEEVDNNEVEVDECNENQGHCAPTNQEEVASYDTNAGTSKTAVASDTDNNQQSQTITSGSCEPTANLPGSANWKQATSSTDMTRQHESSSDVVESSPHGSKFGYKDVNESIVDKPPTEEEVADENIVRDVEFGTADFNQKRDQNSTEENKKESDVPDIENVEENDELEEEYGEDPTISLENVEMIDNESHQSGSATQSEIQEIQQSQMETTSEEIDGGDGVSSEGEKQTVEDLEEEGREAEATTSATITTRSKATRGLSPARRMTRGIARGGNSRPTPIIWQESPGTSRSTNPLGNQSNNPMRGYPNQRTQRGRRMRRPSGNFPNMRFT